MNAHNNPSAADDKTVGRYITFLKKFLPRLILVSITARSTPIICCVTAENIMKNKEFFKAILIVLSSNKRVLKLSRPINTGSFYAL